MLTPDDRACLTALGLSIDTAKDHLAACTMDRYRKWAALSQRGVPHAEIARASGVIRQAVDQGVARVMPANKAKA